MAENLNPTYLNELGTEIIKDKKQIMFKSSEPKHKPKQEVEPKYAVPGSKLKKYKQHKSVYSYKKLRQQAPMREPMISVGYAGHYESSEPRRSRPFEFSFGSGGGVGSHHQAPKKKKNNFDFRF